MSKRGLALKRTTCDCRLPVKECPECRKVHSRFWKLKQLYNLDYDPTIDASCAICGTTEFNGRGPHIDHDHDLNILRGVLCPRCNVMLGMAQDNIKTLQSAIKYIKKYKKRSKTNG